MQRQFEVGSPGRTFIEISQFSQFSSHSTSTTSPVRSGTSTSCAAPDQPVLSDVCEGAEPYLPRIVRRIVAGAHAPLVVETHWQAEPVFMHSENAGQLPPHVGKVDPHPVPGSVVVVVVVVVSISSVSS